MSISAGATRQSLCDMSAPRRDNTILRRTLCPTKACVLLLAAAPASGTAHPNPLAQSLSRIKSTMTCLLTMSMSLLGDAALGVATHTPPLAPAHEANT